MTIKFLSVLCVFVLFFSCKKNIENVETTDTKASDSLKIKVKDVAKIKYTDYILDLRAEDSIVNWAAYKELESVITNVKKADLSFFKNNKEKVNELVSNLKQTIPTEVNSPAIIARIKALETKLLKLESLYNLNTTTKTELIANIKDFFVACSNLNLQINKKIEADNIVIERP